MKTVPSDWEERFDREMRRLAAALLGTEDMGAVLKTVEHLRAGPDDEEDDARARVRRTLETGMFVTYARPFTPSRGLARLKRASGLSQELRNRHAELLALRDQTYAHTDETPHREIFELSDADEFVTWLREREPGEVVLSWRYPTEKLLDDIAALAEAHVASFDEVVRESRQRVIELLEVATEESTP
jgi:hypothetical protein